MNRLFLNVGYDLSEAQLRRWFSRYGVVSDMYLPKHTSGRNKGFGFATFATEEALLLALQTQQHVVDGVLVQVRLISMLACHISYCAGLFVNQTFVVEPAQLLTALHAAGEASWSTTC